MSLEGRPLLGHCGSVEVMNPLIVQASHGGEAQWWRRSYYKEVENRKSYIQVQELESHRNTLWIPIFMGF